MLHATIIITQKRKSEAFCASQQYDYETGNGPMTSKVHSLTGMTYEYLTTHSTTQCEGVLGRGLLTVALEWEAITMFQATCQSG